MTDEIKKALNLDGKEPCPLCSTAEWEIYHGDGVACPKESEDNAAGAATAFPASVETPGQRESRSAYQRLMDMSQKPAWWEDYLELRAAGIDWRKAAWIAWASSPIKRRWPATQEELATSVLGLRSARTIRKWREKNPDLDEQVALFQMAPLVKYRHDVINALIQVASDPDPKSAGDRKTYFQLTKDLREEIRLTGASGGPLQHERIQRFAGMSDDELDGIIANLLALEARNDPGRA